ncbi:hypothetical protein FC093_14110 [Ilyomonas limi]|uniref:Transmembrane protein n=1 Tax=Ilyomonas limi TaxID=2575867 RepID=A0A4U3KZV2_9BACT|nr:DUF6766 family protein [Ilyomonas limi]TKK67429.1 hypothetical protein FC093_14110 [Ilyomonas limi]
MKQFFKYNGLSIVMLLLFVLSLSAQIILGFKARNDEIKDQHGKPFTLSEYLASGHFIEATFENWESEFLQMAAFVLLSVSLYQKGSAESKDPDKEEETDKEPEPKEDAPWPVKKGGFVLTLYKNSLSITFFLLFLISFVIHFYGSLLNYNDDQILMGLPVTKASDYIGNSQFWFESFENWQSEFLSVFCMVVLSIFLRQKGSPQSKPVDAPDSQTGA